MAEQYVKIEHDCNGHEIRIPIVPCGAFGKGVRVAEVRLQNGHIHTFGGELLAEALRNGGVLVRELQKGI